ncbi:3-keto-5-aminohexanoate cleavage protein [Streptomyces sp. NPDC050842]|uniref:3-keto-5-aminohexanoate cleavage protein n=1 Tax=Streptomyces sp. NPDC050842 TaxID=3365636 RepID=UPI0037A7FD1C
MLQVCVNGSRGPGDASGVPMSPESMAEAAGLAVAAGAGDVRVHPRTPCGSESLSPRVLAPVLTAVRAAVAVPVGVTAGAPAEPDPGRRAARVRSWAGLPELPDHASADWHEPGAEKVAAALLELGVGVEAGVRSGTDGPERFARSPLAPRVLRVRAEVADPDPATAGVTARALLGILDVPSGVPVLLHGVDGGTWPVLRLARRLGLGTRIGLADTLLLPDGTRARSNAELVAAALSRTPRRAG